MKKRIAKPINIRRIFTLYTLSLSALLQINYTYAAPDGVTSPAKPLEFKKRISGDSWNGYIKNLIVRINGRRIEPVIYDYRNSLNIFTGAYPAIAIRACPVDSGYWGGEKCITTEGSSIVIPEGTELDTLRFDVKYRVSGVRKQEGKIEDVTFEYAKISHLPAPPKKPARPSDR